MEVSRKTSIWTAIFTKNLSSQRRTIQFVSSFRLRTIRFAVSSATFYLYTGRLGVDTFLFCRWWRVIFREILNHFLEVLSPSTPASFHLSNCLKNLRPIPAKTGLIYVLVATFRATLLSRLYFQCQISPTRFSNQITVEDPMAAGRLHARANAKNRRSTEREARIRRFWELGSNERLKNNLKINF